MGNPDASSDIGAAVTGDTLTGFAAGLDCDTRAAVLNAMLFAQAASNAKYGVLDETNRKEWYNEYVSVLENIGFVVGMNQENSLNDSGLSVTVSKQLLSFIEALASDGTASEVLTASLASINATSNTDQLTLWSQSSSESYGGKTALAYGYDDNGVVTLDIATSVVTTSQTDHSLLFFVHWDTSDTQFYYQTNSLTIDFSIYSSAIQSQVSTKLGAAALDFIETVQITTNGL